MAARITRTLSGLLNGQSIHEIEERFAHIFKLSCSRGHLDFPARLVWDRNRNRKSLCAAMGIDGTALYQHEQMGTRKSRARAFRSFHLDDCLFFMAVCVSPAK